MTESMESESFSAFSPAEPAVDAAFVSKHNQSAEIYQVITKIYLWTFQALFASLRKAGHSFVETCEAFVSNL